MERPPALSCPSGHLVYGHLGCTRGSCAQRGGFPCVPPQLPTPRALTINLQPSDIPDTFFSGLALQPLQVVQVPAKSSLEFMNTCPTAEIQDDTMWPRKAAEHLPTCSRPSRHLAHRYRDCPQWLRTESGRAAPVGTSSCCGY
jgi:hypothetical protein